MTMRKMAQAPFLSCILELGINVSQERVKLRRFALLANIV
jgi:hypothetical protein